MRRTSFQIMAEILDYCKHPRNKTRVMYHTNLSWKLAQNYLHKLQTKNLLEVHNSPITYTTTKKGHKLLEKLKQLTEVL